LSDGEIEYRESSTSMDAILGLLLALVLEKLRPTGSFNRFSREFFLPCRLFQETLSRARFLKRNMAMPSIALIRERLQRRAEEGKLASKMCDKNSCE